MSDPSSWAAPDDASKPRYGQYAPPSAPATAQPGPSESALRNPHSPYSGPNPYSSSRVGPGIRPGPIPLRPLSFADVLDSGFTSIRKNAKVLVTVPVIAAIISIVLGLVIRTLFFSDGVTVPSVGQGSTEELDAILDQSTFSIVAMAAFLAAATPVVMGIIAVALGRMIIGDIVGLGEVIRRGRPVIGKLILVSVIYVLGSIALILSVVLLVALTLAALQVPETDGAVLITALFTIAAALVASGLLLRLSFAPALIAYEHLGLKASLKRSWLLSKGAFWRILGIFIVAQIIGSVLSQLLAMPASVILLMSSTGGISAATAAILTAAVILLANSLALAFTTAVHGVLYFDLRMRREGYDVELIAAAEEHQSV